MFFVSISRYDEAEETLTLLRQFHSAFTAKPQKRRLRLRL
jgi:hypothetical protein